MSGEFEEGVELFLRDVFLVEGNVELALDFRGRSLGVPQKANELGVASSIKAFNLAREVIGTARFDVTLSVCGF